VDARYRKRRRNIRKVFSRAIKRDAPDNVFTSPSGRFQMSVSVYDTGPHTWAYSRGLVTRVSDHKLLADVERNYGHFWHTWVAHPNGNEYLLCGEDYQGYTAINLTDETCHVFFPEAGYSGGGFCWAAVYPSPNRLVLAVEGCYWGSPYDAVFFNFREPDGLPYAEIARIEDLATSEGWLDDKTFALSREVTRRRSDGADYESLSVDEQKDLDANDSLIEYREERLEFQLPPLGPAT
jgi:hypothetical protein